MTRNLQFARPLQPAEVFAVVGFRNLFRESDLTVS